MRKKMSAHSSWFTVARRMVMSVILITLGIVEVHLGASAAMVENSSVEQNGIGS